MFREMRRKNQKLPEAECIEILGNGSSGVLSLLGDDGYPYGVPMSYVYRDGKLYFHSAVAGHKVDAVRACSKASFCVIARDEVVPEAFTTHFVSIVAFGRVRILEGDAALDAIRLLADKYSPDMPEAREEEIRQSMGWFCMMELSIEHLTGKECIELTRRRKG